MSAMMTDDIEMLKGLTLRNPAILKLEESEDEAGQPQPIHCSVILKLKIIKAKFILFVNDVERSYHLKVFLEQFSIKSCVPNSEVPLNSQYHTV
ncbi:hypothetical protein B0H14DRAFT_3487712 [Mycena olivaceomarginata]|nr:hypothetical protein B0H14DRAFT_3487712 [Mycena olivaceomarginata]